MKLSLFRVSSLLLECPTSCLNLPELDELGKQLAKMLDSGISVPGKSPYGTSVLFQKKDDGSLQRYWVFEFKVMPFGLTNALVTFYTMMNHVLQGFLDDFVVFLNDIVIYSDTREEHAQHVRKDLIRPWENELYAKPSKCSVAQTLISFLDHIIEQ
ncbi:Retrovirus-related Pol polyprotein from transposon 17.6 [Abeliophyllum distichum]|uniref:Retrovirus-related Pol polyprotein from transposon 17.6 n=1 Tax=Abeliophyllum distichum TaxID=126358 RepID=A0ABD1VX87_9LAMI